MAEPELSEEPQQPQRPRKRVDELKRGDKAYMFGTIVTIKGQWHVPFASGVLDPGWGRIDMVWDGAWCNPSLRGDTVVELQVPRQCPDGGTCHHDCAQACFRVLCCSPLSAAGYPDDKWPAEILADPRPVIITGDDGK